MMPSFKYPLSLYILALALLLPFSRTGLCAEMVIDDDRQWAYARSLLENRQYRRAAEEFQRFAFFFPGHPDQRRALLEAGKSFLQARDPQSAQAPFKTLIADRRLDPMAVEAHFLLAESHIQSGSPSLAVVGLANLIALSDDPEVEDRAYHRIGWIHIDALDWQRAVAVFDRISPAGQVRYNIAALKADLGKTDKIPRKSPALAGTLSIVPGGGQLYTRRYKDAAVAFVINVGTFWAAYEAFDNDQSALGSLLAVIGIGFYSGNIYGAVNDARKYNTWQKRQYVDQLRHHLSLNPPGASRSFDQGILLGWRFSF